MASNVIPLGPLPDDIDPAEARALALASAAAWTVEERAKAQVRAEELTLTDEIAEAMRASTLADLKAAQAPDPHLFRDGNHAAFPRGEAAIVAGPGREGKTSALLAVCVAGALGLPFGRLAVEAGAFSTVIFSAEDSLQQYRKKLGTQIERLAIGKQKDVLERVRIVDLEPFKDTIGPLVVLNDRNQPKPNAQLIEAIIAAAVRPLDGNAIDGEWDAPLGLIVLETASTLSDAAEDNVGLRVLASVAKRIARDLGVAVIISHHTSQAAAMNLPTLELSSGDIRGATALVFNTRQTWMLVNLGSEEDPFKDRDARTLLRSMVRPGGRSRVSMLVCLDSSKSIEPAPVFYEWDGTRQVQVDVPGDYQGMHWRKLHRQIGKAKAEAMDDDKADAERVELRRVAACVAALSESGMQPTITAVATRLGRGKSWAAPRLAAAHAAGLVRTVLEAVPRCPGLVTVYRPLEGEE